MKKIMQHAIKAFCSRTLHTSSHSGLEYVFNHYLSLVELTRVQDPHTGLVIATLNFKKPYPGVDETELLSISSSVLGMFKLESKIIKGYFLAPKSYAFVENDPEGRTVLKHKGAAKSLVTLEWFQSQYEDPSRKLQVSVTSNFKIDWKELEIHKQDSLYKLGLSMESKRLPVYRKKKWIDTEPIQINDLSNIRPILGEKNHILFKEYYESSSDKY